MTKPFQMPPRTHDVDADLVVVTRGELRLMLVEAVRSALAEAPPAPTSADWLDAAGAAALLGVHPRTVGNMAARGELRHSRVGRLLRFARADVEAVLGVSSTAGR